MKLRYLKQYGLLQETISSIAPAYILLGSFKNIYKPELKFQ